MTPHAREALEAEIRRRCDAKEYNAATTVALRGYGPELYGFLLGFHRAEADASEVFSLLSERVWLGMERFDWASSFRAWAYAIARNSSITYRERTNKRAKRFADLPDSAVLGEIVENARSATKSYLKTGVRARIAELRESLSPEDQMVLVLRVDRKLSWVDLARVMSDDENAMTEESLKRESARLRKRFQLIKESLLKRSREAG